MKAVIPSAGQGTRLYPHTHTRPKAMVRVAGRPILGHILLSLSDTVIKEVVVVVGEQMKDQIINYAEETFGDRFDFEFPVQETPDGLGHSIYQTELAVGDDPMLIVLGDMLFEGGYESFLKRYQSLRGADGTIGVKRVDEPRHYGVVEVDGDGYVCNLVEKPDDPPSDLAISGIYIVENSPLLFESLQYLISNNLRGAGKEFQLTDAFQRMVDEGGSIDTFEVDQWYDCGRPETLLEANRVMLTRYPLSDPRMSENAVVIPPVDFGEDVTIESSVIGPNVSVDDGSVIRNSLVEESIIGLQATVRNSNLKRSIIGNHTVVEGKANRVNLGDNSSLNL